MSIKDMCVESKIPVEEHRYIGWFWHLEPERYYRWNDLMALYERDYFDTDLSSTKTMEIEHGDS